MRGGKRCQDYFPCLFQYFLNYRCDCAYRVQRLSESFWPNLLALNKKYKEKHYQKNSRITNNFFALDLFSGFFFPPEINLRGIKRLRIGREAPFCYIGVLAPGNFNGLIAVWVRYAQHSLHNGNVCAVCISINRKFRTFYP